MGHVSDIFRGGAKHVRLFMPVFFLAIVVLGLPGLALAEPAWKASLAVGQEYNDNTDEEPNGREDYITSLRPSVSYQREGSRLQVSSAYRGNYQYYARNTQDEDFNHDLAARALLDVWDSFFFLEATDTFRLVNRDRTKGDVYEDDATAGLVQQNTFTFSPYIAPRFGPRGLAKIGYAFTNIWTEDGEDAKDIHRAFLDGSYELTVRTDLLSGYAYTQELSDDDDVDRHVAYLGVSHDYAENGNLFLKFGPQYSRYRDQDASSTSLYWDAGLDHDFGAVSLKLSTGVSFEDDPETGQTYERRFGTVRVTKDWERTIASVFTTLEDYEDDGEAGPEDSVQSVRRTVLGFNLNHELSARLSASLGLIYDFENDSDADTKRWLANLGFNYALSEKQGLGLWYRFKDSASNDADEDYRVNRTGAQLTWTF